jgi:hypothetical protein
MPLISLIGLVGIVLRGPFALPIPDAAAWAEAATQPLFAVGQILLIAGYVLPFFGFWALYAYMSESGPEQSAFWGFMLSVWGTALALPGLGITAFAGPLAAESYLAGQLDASSLITTAMMSRGFALSIMAAVGYIIGPILLGIALWRSGTAPKWAALLFALHGICLSLGFGMYPILIVGWLLLIASGIGIATSYKHEA